MPDYKKLSAIAPTPSPTPDATVIITSAAGDFRVPLSALVRIDRTITTPTQLPATAALDEVRWFVNAARQTLECHEYRADNQWHQIL